MSSAAAHAPRNIVLVGRTGVGKSTIGSLLMGNDNAFEVGHMSVSHTKDCSKQTIDHNGMAVKIAVVDTIGIGDTNLDKPTVLKKIAKVVKEFPEGLHGIFFVFDSRFTEAERTAYSLITKILFPSCEKQLYLIRNKFRLCEDVSKTQEDVNQLGQDEFTKTIFKNTPAKNIVHVDSNPDAQKRAEFTRDTLLTLIGTLETTYAAPQYNEIYERIKDANEEEAGKIVSQMTDDRLNKMSGLEVLGLGLGKTANDFKGLLEKQCTVM